MVEASQQQKVQMEYRFLGNSGLKVSAISFGNWLNSDDPQQVQRMTTLVKKAWDLGINFFDTAEVYGDGQAEKQFAVALKNLNVSREEYVLSTKVFWGPNRNNNINDVGLSRKHIIEGVNNSLKRLEHDYVDIIFCHRFDNLTPLEETIRAFDSLIKQGKTHYWGTSEWSAANIFEAIAICNKYNLVLPVGDQTQYNMFVRDKLEVDYDRLFDLYGYGTTVWSPLAGGLLTGRYNKGIPEDSRLSVFANMFEEKIQKYFSEENKPKYTQMFEGLRQISEEIGCTQAQLAMAWVLKYKNVSTAITGASKPEQLDDIVGAIKVQEKLTPEILKRIEDLIQSKPSIGQCARGGANNVGWGNKKSRR